MTRRPPPLCWRRRRRRPTRRSSLARITASRTWRGGRRGTWRGLATTRRRGGTRRWTRRRPRSGKPPPPRTARMRASRPSSWRRSGGGRTWSERRVLRGSRTPAALACSLRPRRPPATATRHRRLTPPPPTTRAMARPLPTRREVSSSRITGLGSAPRSRTQRMGPTTEAAGTGAMGRRWLMTMMTTKSSCHARRRSCRGDAPRPRSPARLIR